MSPRVLLHSLLKEIGDASFPGFAIEYNLDGKGMYETAVLVGVDRVYYGEGKSEGESIISAIETYRKETK